MAGKKQKRTANNTKRTIRGEINHAKEEVRVTLASTTSLIISALTLVAGLAWNDVAKALFERLKEKFSGWGETIGLLLYALVVTVIVVLVVQRLKTLQEKVGGKSIK
ncbi:MAG: DUF5654 family protein [Candidatus Dojkabacteria bacterium]|nr:DUF5654 family protein [Candidatus Dojkabacteria bacterium]